MAESVDGRVAREREIAEERGSCLKANGWQNPFVPPTRALVESEQHYLIYRDLSIAEAHGHGYGFEDEKDTSTTPYDAYVNTLTSSERQLFLEQAGACTEQAVTRVLPGYERYMTLLSQLNSAYATEMERMESGQEYAQLSADYAACMASAGYMAQDVNDAVLIAQKLVSEANDVPSKLAAERRVAVSDATCRQRTQYGRRIVALLQSVDSALLDRNASLVLAVVEAWNGAEKRQ